MSHDQFLEIHTMLHPNNNETQTDYVPLYKMKPILNSIMEFLDIIHYPIFNLKTFLRLDSVPHPQVEAYLVWTMDNVQKLNNCTDIPVSQIFRSYSILNSLTF
jgi:hypothetical protein